MQIVLETLWTFANSPVGVTLVSGAFLYVLNRLYAAKPGWAAMEGTIISAVRNAEKMIPNDTPNKGAARLDMALNYVIQVYESSSGKMITAKKATEIKEGIQIVHNQLATQSK